MLKIIPWFLVFCVIIGHSFAQNLTDANYIPWLQRETQPQDSHDPGVLRDNRGIYTLVSTNNLLSIRQSTDKSNWTNQGRVFNVVPPWMTGVYGGIENLWAPHLAFMGGRYWIYYSGSLFGQNTSLIGVASSPTLDVASPDYRWTDHGEVIRTDASNNYNAIDPELLIDAQGRAWLSLGSFWDGLRMIRIDTTTGKPLATDRTIYRIASRGGDAIEGPATLERNGFFYLFSSWDRCCAGVNSTYRTMVGRSTNPNSGFVDRLGTALTNGGGTQLLAGYGRYIGPGGGSAFRDGRRYYYALHYYDSNRGGMNVLQMREIVWTADNWPVLGQPFLGRHLAYEAEHAIINNAQLLTTTTANQASNFEYVGFINEQNSFVEFVLNPSSTGSYWVRVRYAAGLGNATHLVTLNGGHNITVNYPATTAWGVFPQQQVVIFPINLNEGYNTLRFAKGEGFAELDRIDLIVNPSRLMPAGAFERFGNGAGYRSSNSASITTGAWVQYENIGLGDGYSRVQICLASGLCRLRMELGPQNPITQEMDLQNGCQSLELNAGVRQSRGVHDVTLRGVSGACELSTLQFMPDSPVSNANLPEKYHPIIKNKKSIYQFNLLGQQRKLLE